ncbi:sigma-70 family RNA polymerase sigma factor [Pseudooceanicola sp. HF7]|uniref:sigma-70 family RNA polymerase sigma factor n=1 Tax=Pseudooceanicola sp. HF7 TaxID=2721560 RepID=UPI0020CA7049|nr:sigma-70 family RNA polymerase sigma factor [Pseudooceanicola sp. HF7]
MADFTGASTGGVSTIVTDHAALISACAAGEKQALKTLMKAEGGRMLGVARRMLRRSDLAEDAVQDALVLVWRRAHQFDASRGSAKGWLYTILRNRCLTMLRQEDREVATEADQIEATSQEAVLTAAFDGLETTTGLRQCLERLDGATRQAILSSYVLGHSHGEIAGRLDAPLGTIKARVRRGLLKLRECLS